ncbi:hypothetical protein NAF17_06090 [Mucilaginibacter sp. RB4R14]|uniref:hypothetical protein n=1 Tax=Mucilaginibacter aurantiaciroseus TaxID=2949308 RepID=UPI0020914772|nr:hypothetical protein [Mucilaginibacter aurantiaciroseus]MCO5935101.1 hypothetical protein [Mucilaginibacter aurantiaciroseus]
MSKNNKFIIRRTLSQERFEILWKKRSNGQATLRDLTEMDEIINRDAGVRQFVLEEMAGEENPNNDVDIQDMMKQPLQTHQSFINKLKSFLNKLFHNFTATRLQPTGNY